LVVMVYTISYWFVQQPSLWRYTRFIWLASVHFQISLTICS